MNVRERRYAFLLRNISSVLMVFAVVCALNNYFALEISLPFLLIASITADVVIVFLDHFKKSAALWLSIAGILLFAAVVLEIMEIPVRPLLQSAAEWIRDAVEWFREMLESKEEVLPEPGYLLFFACAAVAVCTIVIYPLTFHLISRLILSGAALAALILLPFFGVELGKLPLAFVGICVVSSLIELVNLQFDRSRVESKRSAGLFLYPVSVLLLVLAVLLPSRETPIRWQMIRDMISRVSYQLESVGTDFKIWFGLIPENFTITFSGAKLSEEEGSVEVTEPSRLMHIGTSGMMRSPAYLRGSVSNVYTGSGWKDNAAEHFTEQEPQIELWEIMYFLRRNDVIPEPNESLYKRTTLFVDFDDVVTKSLLYGSPISNIEVGAGTRYSANGTNLKLNRMEKIGFGYSMTYYETNWGSPTLIGHLRSLSGFRYVDDHTDFEEIQAVSGTPLEVDALVNRPDPDFYNEDVAQHFAERARTIREVYTDLPDTVPDRVRALAEEITADCETTYDKILAIEDYFTDRYTYTLTPPVYPGDRDFADWFLFDCTEGYCTYFATAAAVLARCVGLPSRYVEGVLVSQLLRSRDVMDITNRDVHAWTEIYLEGYGWILIEATPGTGTGRNKEWERRSPNAASPIVDRPEIPPQEEEEIEPVEPVRRPENQGPSEAELAALAAARRERQQRLFRITSLIALGVILLVFTLFMLISRHMKAVRYNRAGDDDKIRLLMREIMRCISITGVRIKGGETLLEYVDRAGLGFDYSDMKLRDAAMLFMKIRYAGRHATRAEVLAMYRYARELRRETLKKQNVLRRMLFSVRQYVQ